MATVAVETMKESELLDKLISDYGPSKYRDIVWAMEWARHVRMQEEYRNIPMAELIEKAMLDVISKKVTNEQILEAVNKDMAVAEKLAEKKDTTGDKKREEKARK